MKAVLGLLLVIIVGCGKDGAQGPAGSQGPAGAPGTAGTPGATISSGKSCLKIDGGSGTNVLYTYRTILYSTGDRFVTAEVTMSAMASSSVVYKSGQVGATSGGASVTYSLPGDAGGGYWDYSLVGTTAKVIYNNVSSTHNGYTYTFAAGDCTSF